MTYLTYADRNQEPPYWHEMVARLAMNKRTQFTTEHNVRR